MAIAWFKAKICKRKARSTFGNRMRSDGREEYIIKVPGFAGELRKYMTEEEAVELVEKSNKAAFMSAAEASKRGLYGIEEFNRTGMGQAGVRSAVARAAARGFGISSTKKEK